MTEGNIIKSKSEPCPSMGRKEGSSVHPIVAKQRSTVNLPDVVLRRVISYLGAHDLRAFHQVCSAWKAALEDQSSQNRRRILLVEKIRVNKENLLNGSAIQDAVPVQLSTRCERSLDAVGKKTMDCSVLMDCTNYYDNTTSPESPPACSSCLTPVSPFDLQELQEITNGLGNDSWSRPKHLQLLRIRGSTSSSVASDDFMESDFETDYDEGDSKLEDELEGECKKLKSLSMSTVMFTPVSPMAYVSPVARKSTKKSSKRRLLL